MSPVIFAFVILGQAVFLLPFAAVFLLLCLVWFALAGPYLFWSFPRWLVQRICGQPSSLLLPDIAARRRISSYLIVFAALAYSNLALTVPFSMIKSSLDVYADHLYTQMPMLTPSEVLNRRIGIYYLRDVRIGPEGVFMSINARQMIYRPDRKPLYIDNAVRLEPLFGNWFALSYSELLESPWPYLY